MNQIACIAIIRNEQGKVLTEYQKAKDTLEIFLPGGKIDENESCKECVKREAEEELGIQIEVGNMVAMSESSYDNIEMTNLYYEAKIISGEPKIQEEGKLKEVGYRDIEEVFNFDKIKWFNN